jgi:hypothetical protein
MRRENLSETHALFYVPLESLPVGMREHELWHPLQLEETCSQALRQLDDSSQLQQESQALQA